MPGLQAHEQCLRKGSVTKSSYILYGKVNLQGSYNYKKTLVYFTIIKAEEVLGIMPIFVSQPNPGISVLN